MVVDGGTGNRVHSVTYPVAAVLRVKPVATYRIEKKTYKYQKWTSIPKDLSMWAMGITCKL